MSLAAERHPIVTDKAPRPLAGAPYSQAIASRGLIFCSGQVPLTADAQALVEGGITEQTHQVLQNLRAVIEAAGSTMNDVVKTTVFLTNLDDFAQMNEVYATYFDGTPPARSTIEVSKLPAGASVEIEAIVCGE